MCYRFVMNSFIQNLLRQALADKTKWTTQSLLEAAAEAISSPEREFLRLPPPGQKCPITRLTRGFLNQRMRAIPTFASNDLRRFLNLETVVES